MKVKIEQFYLSYNEGPNDLSLLLIEYFEKQS